MTSETAVNGDDRVQVLYVGTDSDDAETLSTALERENGRFTVETVRTAPEAVARLADDTVDCLVSDYDLPEQNGIELLETVRDEHPASRLLSTLPGGARRSPARRFRPVSRTTSGKSRAPNSMWS